MEQKKAIQRITAGELANKASKDATDYNLLELGNAICEDIPNQLRDSIEKHKLIFDKSEKEFCVVRQKATDPLLKTAVLYKYYCYLYLPSPRPEQNVFLYNRDKDDITKRLWSLPSPARMSQLSTTKNAVPKEYEEMQAWSIAFYQGTFWEFIRYQHKIDMLSEHEYFLQHRDKLIKAGCKVPGPLDTEPFDFSKIHIDKIVDTQEAIAE